MAHVPFMLAGGFMQVYRARNPKKSPLWQCASRHYDEFLKYSQAERDRLVLHFGSLDPYPSVKPSAIPLRLLLPTARNNLPRFGQPEQVGSRTAAGRRK